MNNKMMLKNAGLQIGKCHLPPFELYSGQKITLTLPNSRYFFSEQYTIIKLLTGRDKLPEISVYGGSGLASNYLEGADFLPITRLGKTKNWIKRFLLKPIRSIENFLFWKGFRIKQLFVPPRLPGNDELLKRISISLEQCDYLVYNVGGCDQEGIENCDRFVDEHVKKYGMSAIKLEFVDILDEDTEYVIASKLS